MSKQIVVHNIDEQDKYKNTILDNLNNSVNMYEPITSIRFSGLPESGSVAIFSNLKILNAFNASLLRNTCCSILTLLLIRIKKGQL